MTIRKLRTVIGLGIVAAHFGALLLIGILTAFFEKFTPEEMFVMFGMVAPLFAAYTTAIFRAFMGDKKDGEMSPKADAPRIILSIGTVSFFVLVVFGSILWKSFGPLSMDGLVKLVGFTETLLGGYVVIVVESFFGPIQE